jgi:hypothetical protein
MSPQRRAVTGIVLLAAFALLVAAGRAGAHYPLAGGRIHVGPNPDPPPWSSDNGNPGNALPIYEGYHWPSLREALDQYGWFGRKGCPQHGATGPSGAPPKRRPWPAR